MSNDYFDHLVGPLKRAAIDAWMRSDDSGYWDIDGGKYVKNSRGTDFSVTRPGEDGEGGGNWEASDFFGDFFGLLDRDEEFTSSFDTIRSNIDNALSKWSWIPDPADVGPLVESMRNANSRLSVGAVQSGGTVTGGGSIAGNINLIMENSDAMAGGMTTAFKADFLAQLSKAISGQHAITVILGGHLAAQQGMWEAARQTVKDIIESATSAFNEAASQGGMDWKTILKVAGYASAGVSLFAEGGAKIAIGVIDLGIKFLDGAAPANTTKTAAPDASYNSVMDAFTRDLDDLATAITTEETAIRDNLTENLRLIRADQGSYDLTRPAILDVRDDSDLGAPGEIRIDRVLVKEITDTYLPNIADELLAAKGYVWDTANLIALLRDSSIGVGQYGPSEQFHDLRYLEVELLGNLGFEVRQGGQTLSLAVDDIGQADTGASDALERHHDSVKDMGRPGGVYDPWN